MSTGDPELSVIVTTIGRPDDLTRLMTSIVDLEPGPSLEVIVVDQSEDRCCLSVLNSREWPFPVVGLTSGRGASVGRNAGFRVARAPVVTFPDDNAWYLASSLADAVRLFTPELALLSGLQVTSDGRPSMLRWLGEASDITPLNVQRAAIESTIFVRSTVFQAVGGFNEGIGVGSPGPYQAGEVTDLVLRVLARGGSARFNPDLRIVSEDPRDRYDESFRSKMRGYGRGMGHLYRMHPLPKGQLAYFCARKLAGAPWRAIQGRPDLGRADVAWVLGAIEGFRGSEVQ